MGRLKCYYIKWLITLTRVNILNGIHCIFKTFYNETSVSGQYMFVITGEGLCTKVEIKDKNTTSFFNYNRDRYFRDVMTITEFSNLRY